MGHESKDSGSYIGAAVFGVLCWTVERCVDAGHGGIDGGVVGITTKTKEAEVNLLVTYKLKKLLESVGIQAFLTRTDENALCADDVYTKKLDMQLRGELIGRS